MVCLDDHFPGTTIGGSVHPIVPTFHHYAWGSTTAIPDLMGMSATSEPVAEAWFGAHPSAPSPLVGATGSLLDLIGTDPVRALGADVIARFGERLPFLLKVIAPAAPLSLQLHPSIEQAESGFAAEDTSGVPIDAPYRSYRDRNHKPELVYALNTFEALSGFRAPRRAAELLDGLNAVVAARLHRILREHPTAEGVGRAFRLLLDPEQPVTPEQVSAVASACARRLADGTSPSIHSDTIVGRLFAAFPSDPGVVASLLLNPVTLQPGEAMFVPAGTVHAYLGGLAVEVMANSDNVLRAGLTTKHVDVPAVLEVMETVAAPPIRLAPEQVKPSTQVFYAPVDDFELTIVDCAAHERVQLTGRGPRIMLALDSELGVSVGDASVTLARGSAVFIPASLRRVELHGCGLVAQADVP